MNTKSIAVIALLVGVASAGCPNQCSGHGTCNAYDLCTCYNHWDGYDCSDRVCPRDGAWFVPSPADSAVASNHAEMYCSNRGTCDTKTGQCKCGEGFTGTACMRSECPNDCSGHGICRQLADFNSYSAWDADKIQGCVCDSTGGSGHGFEGPDCSLVRCPENEDALTGDTYSHSWSVGDTGDLAGNTGDHHVGQYCSDRGTCDFSTGLCQCYTGFTGVQCETRTSLA